MRARLHHKIGAATDRRNVSFVAGQADAISNVGLEKTDALGLFPVKVEDVRDAEATDRFDEIHGGGMFDRWITDNKGSLFAVERTRGGSEVLESLEIGQYVFPFPPRIAQTRPVVEIATIAADVYQSVNGATAPERLAARPINASIAQCRNRFGEVAPVVALILEKSRHACRGVNPEPLCRGPCFQQKHPDIRVIR